MLYIGDTPYRRYPEIRAAVQNGEVSLLYNRSTGYRLACQARKSLGVTFLFIPAVTAVVLYILCMYLPIPKGMIAFCLAGILLYPFVPYISRVMLAVGTVLILLPLFILPNHLWLLAIGVGLIVIRFAYFLWWMLISRAADRSLLEDEKLFEAEWKEKNIALRSSGSNINYIFGAKRAEQQKDGETAEETKKK